MKKAIQKATSFVRAYRIPFIAAIATLVIALFAVSCTGTNPDEKDPTKATTTTASTQTTAAQTTATGGETESTTDEQTTQPTDEVSNGSEGPTAPTTGDAVETTTSSKPTTTTTKKPTTTKAPTTTLPVVDTGEDTPKDDDEVIDPLTGKPRYVVKVEEKTNSKGLKGILTYYSDGSVESVMECQYCHKMPCPDGGKEKCSHYKMENDPTKTCMYCGLPKGDGHNGTCFGMTDWENGGQHICNHYD